MMSLQTHDTPSLTLPSHITHTRDLAPTPLFSSIETEELPVHERINIAHNRARAIGLAYDFNARDILSLSRKFWDLWVDPIVTIDGAATTLLLIQLNLAAGTLAPFAARRPELQVLLDDLLAFRISGQFLMTELGHGLDAINMETTATLQADGTFDLFTPNDRAAKYMPPTLPLGGVPRVGIVMARLIVSGTDHGIRPFVVPLNDGKEMCKNIVAREIPTRSGAKPVGHALTYFDHVTLPKEALLGDLSPSADPRKQFLLCAHRIAVGSITVAAAVIPALRVGAYIVARYSGRRLVRYSQAQAIPVLSFRTQQIPIAHALAQAAVLEALYPVITALFSGRADDPMPAIFKALAFRYWRKSGIALTDLLGAQGLFGFNQLIAMDMDLRGASVAEGDVLALSIRCTFEIIAGRYTLPPSSNPDSYLALHESGLIDAFRMDLLASGQRHREATFSQKIMPRALDFMYAIGDRMAYEAAFASNVPEALIRLYEATAIHSDSPWYIEQASLGHIQQVEMENNAVTDTMTQLESHLDEARVGDYVASAISTEESWNNFSSTLTAHRGDATYDPYRPRSRL